MMVIFLNFKESMMENFKKWNKNFNLNLEYKFMNSKREKIFISINWWKIMKKHLMN